MDVYFDFSFAQKLVYASCDLVCKNVIVNKESKGYGACSFEINDKRVIFRVGKITPNKLGYFVTLWKRNIEGVTIPYDMLDPFDLCIISVKKDGHYGQFVFPKSVLYQEGVISKDGRGGKRAMRVYPSWSIVSSSQAQKTKEWQCKYFFEVDNKGNVDQGYVKKLFL